MKISLFYVGTSLLAPLKRAESEINKSRKFRLELATHNCGAPLNEPEWRKAEEDIASSELVFVIHVTESENAARIAASLDRHRERNNAVIAFNCMPDLMRRARLGKLDFGALMKSPATRASADRAATQSTVR